MESFVDSDQDTDSDVQDLAGEFRSRLNSKGHNSNSITEKLHEELIKAKEVTSLSPFFCLTDSDF